MTKYARLIPPAVSPRSAPTLQPARASSELFGFRAARIAIHVERAPNPIPKRLNVPKTAKRMLSMLSASNSCDQLCGLDGTGFDPDLDSAVSIEDTEILSPSSVPVTRTRMLFFAVILSR